MSMPVCSACQRGDHCHTKNYVVYAVGPMLGGSQCKCDTCGCDEPGATATPPTKQPTRKEPEMSNIPEEAVESAAKVLFCMQHRLSEKAFATAQFRGLADAARREARNALTAAAPHLRAAWAEEVRAIDIPEHRLHDQLPSDHWYAGQKAMRDEIVTLLEGGGE